MWKDIKDYEGLYQINEFGEVKNKFNRLLKPKVNKFGYGRYNLCKNNIVKDYYIHRLVAIAFIDNTDNKPTVNHKDGNKMNNHISNLEWSTYSENLYHSFRELGRKSMGGAPFGNKNNKNRNLINGRFESNKVG